jgi:hypothetical protein
MNNLIKILVFCVIISISSCSTSKYYGDENLGAGYFLSKDGKYKSIDYSPDKKYKGDGGYAVIKENIKSINFNESYIIILTSKHENITNEIKNYWIIDKAVPINITEFKNQNEFNRLLKVGLTGPLDSLGFYHELKVKNINLKFENK